MSGRRRCHESKQCSNCEGGGLVFTVGRHEAPFQYWSGRRHDDYAGQTTRSCGDCHGTGQREEAS